MSRLPKGYIGIQHETLGSDILAVLHSLRAPEQILDAATLARLHAIDAKAWYPVATLLDLMAHIELKLGRFGMLKLGRTVFRLTHEERVRERIKSARDLVYGIDEMYKHANRGTAIGGWRVLQFGPGHAVLEKNTPHSCLMEEGILMQALTTVGTTPLIEQPDCIRDGAPTCKFVLSSSIADARWTG